MSILKMLIVDDEALARYAFRTLISKNFSNIEIVGEAESGNQAIEMVRALKPDIVAMDIKMPGINGIEASEEILSQFPDINILILTAYDNFSYVQKALDMGVKGYLLKPFKKEQVIEKINVITNNIDGKKESKDIHKQIENKIKIVKPFMERELISAIITGNVDAAEIGSYINFLQGNIYSGYFMLFSFEQSNTENINDSIRNKIYREKIQSVVEKHLPQFKECIFGSPIGNLIVTFIIIRETAAEKIIINESVAIANEMKRRIKVVTGVDCAIGIGKSYTDIKSFKNSFNEAGIAIKEGIRESTVVHFDSFKYDPVKIEKTYPVALENELLEELRVGNFSRTRELAEEIISNITNGYVDFTLLKEYISMFVIGLKRTILQFGIGIDGLSGAGLISEISNIEERDELIFWCKTNVFRIIEIAESLKQNKDTSKVKKVHDYINRNLNKDITLEMAAEEAGLTPQYFSKVFKEETGKNFVEYLTEKRINYATRLMKSTDKNIKEISKMVGYADVNYFCRMFKKTTGATPKQYKEAK